jgi:hypothetical protein
MTPAALELTIIGLAQSHNPDDESEMVLDVFTTEANGHYTGTVSPRFASTAGMVLVLKQTDDIARDYEWYVACEHIVAIRMAQP